MEETTRQKAIRLFRATADSEDRKADLHHRMAECLRRAAVVAERNPMFGNLFSDTFGNLLLGSMSMEDGYEMTVQGMERALEAAERL